MPTRKELIERDATIADRCTHTRKRAEPATVDALDPLVTFSVWICIEKHDQNADAEQEYDELDAPGAAVATFDTYDEAYAYAEQLTTQAEQIEPPAASLPAGIANTPHNRQAIYAELLNLCANPSIEYPDFLRLQTLNGRVGHLGTANGSWQMDIMRRGRAGDVDAPVDTLTIPATHSGSAEGIARFCVGTLAGLLAYTAYPTEQAAKAADRAERQARNDR
jgi:hypothetical protein